MPRPPLPISPPINGIAVADPEQIPPDRAREMENWIYRNKVFQVRPGLTKIAADINERPAGYFGYVDHDGTYRLVLGTNLGWRTLEGDVWTDITDSGDPLTAGIEQAVFRIFQKAGTTWLLGTNGVDKPKKWDSDSANDYALVGGTPPKARCMMVLADHVILGNLKDGGTISPVAYDVSKRLDFDLGWGSTLVGLLSNAEDIIAMEEIGEFLGAIHCVDSIWLAIAQGGSAPFRFEPKVHYKEGEGPASTLAVVNSGRGGQIILSANGSIHWFDSANWTSIWPDASRYIQKTANIAALPRAWVDYDHINKEVLFAYPEVGQNDPNIGVIVNEDTGAPFPIRWPNKAMTAGIYARLETGLRLGEITWALGTISQTLGELGTPLHRMLLGEVGGQSYQVFGVTDDGTGIPFFGETGLFALGDGVRFKTLRRLEHRFGKSAAAQTVTIKVGKSNNGEDRTLSSGHNIDIFQVGGAQLGKYNKTGHRISSKFLSLRVEGTATQSVVWRQSYAHLNERGYR